MSYSICRDAIRNWLPTSLWLFYGALLIHGNHPWSSLPCNRSTWQEELNAIVTEDDGLTDAANFHVIVSRRIPGCCLVVACHQDQVHYGFPQIIQIGGAQTQGKLMSTAGWENSDSLDYSKKKYNKTSKVARKCIHIHPKSHSLGKNAEKIKTYISTSPHLTSDAKWQWHGILQRVGFINHLHTLSNEFSWVSREFGESLWSQMKNLPSVIHQHVQEKVERCTCWILLNVVATSI